MRLNETARLSHVDDHIARKLAGPEQSIIDDADLDFYRTRHERLTFQREATHASSSLTDVPTARLGLNDLLIRLRLRSLG